MKLIRASVISSSSIVNKPLCTLAGVKSKATIINIWLRDWLGVSQKFVSCSESQSHAAIIRWDSHCSLLKLTISGGMDRIMF